MLSSVDVANLKTEISRRGILRVGTLLDGTESSPRLRQVREHKLDAGAVEWIMHGLSLLRDINVCLVNLPRSW